MVSVDPCASSIELARYVTSRDRVDRVEHSTRILRSPHPVGLGNLPDPRVRVGRVNPIGLKLDPTITLRIYRLKTKIIKYVSVNN
jgi:hypothetical protein